MRLIAIALVVGLHLDDFVKRKAPPNGSDLVSTALANGGRGVLIFFMLSGFILGLPFAEHWLAGGRKPRARAYYLRRLTRLEPPYVIAMCGLALATIVFGRLSPRDTLRELGASLICAHSFIFGDFSHINGVAWTLENELAEGRTLVNIRGTSLVVHRSAAGSVEGRPGIGSRPEVEGGS